MTVGRAILGASAVKVFANEPIVSIHRLIFHPHRIGAAMFEPGPPIAILAQCRFGINPIRRLRSASRKLGSRTVMNARLVSTARCVFSSRTSINDTSP
jgi:hypothetical protein